MKVDMRMYRVIYDAINEIEAAMKGMLAPKFKEVDLGRAEVRNVFRITGVGMVAGCYVLDGKMQRNAQMRLLRDNIVIYDGAIASLQRFKDSVKEVAAGYECGITFEKFQDIKEGDIIEAFIMEEMASADAARVPRTARRAFWRVKSEPQAKISWIGTNYSNLGPWGSLALGIWGLTFVLKGES